MKTHYVVTTEPEKFSQELSALCGKRIANPEIVIMQETEMRGVPEFNSLLDCPRCYRRVEMETKFSGRTYVYGIVEAQEAKNAQADAA